MNKLRCGDVRPEDGKIFWGYSRGKEYWYTPKQFEVKKQKRRVSNKRAVKNYASAHPEQYNQIHQKWRKQHPHEYKVSKKKSDKKYRDSHPEVIRKIQKKQYSRLSVKIKSNLRSRMGMALKSIKIGKAASTQELLGAPFELVQAHITSLFLPGMTWENHGVFDFKRRTWHIDHKRPCSSFDLTDPDQQRQCFHYTNLQPLWALDNMLKGYRIL